MLTRTVGLFALLFWSSAAALPQTGSNMQAVLDRLDQLEKQNQQLIDEIRSLRQQLTSGALSPPPPPTPASDAESPAPPLSERMDVQESRTAELAQSKVETSQKMPVALTGMLVFNAFANSRNGGGLQNPVSAQLTPGPRTSGATFRQTVLGLKFNGPDLPGGGKASGSFYFDFFSGTTAPSNNLLRIRLATIELAWKNTSIIAGQDKPIIAPREPMSLAQIGLAPLTGAGNLWDWNPEIRVVQKVPFNATTSLSADVGVFQTTENYPGTSAPAFAATLERARPAWEGRFNLSHGTENHRYEFAPGFHVSNSHVAGQSVESKLFSADWLLHPVNLFEVTGAYFTGTNAAGLGGLRQGFTVLNNGTAKPVHTTGMWSQLAIVPAPRWMIHLYGGQETNRAADLLAGSINRNRILAGNVVYKLAPNVLAAFEISQNRTNYLFSGLRLNNHYDLALAYLF